MDSKNTSDNKGDAPKPQVSDTNQSHPNPSENKFGAFTAAPGPVMPATLDAPLEGTKEERAERMKALNAPAAEKK